MTPGDDDEVIAAATAPLHEAAQDDEEDGREGDGRPPKPGTDALAAALLGSYEFARDTGGELFLLPGESLPDVPYIPRSFLTRDVKNLAHVTWRDMAQAWNGWLAENPEAAEDEKLTPAGLTPSDTLINNVTSHLEALGSQNGRVVSAALRAVQATGGSCSTWATPPGRWRSCPPRAGPWATRGSCRSRPRCSGARPATCRYPGRCRAGTWPSCGRSCG